MLWAIDSVNGSRILPRPNARGKCPSCESPVIAKCGVINEWHWSHSSRDDCDSWSEPESQWHIDWKMKYPRKWQEVRMGKHRADVKTKKMVVEFQASPISPVDITEREIFYGEMVWLIRGHDFRKRFKTWRTRMPDLHGSARFQFKWTRNRKCWNYAHAGKVIDFGLGQLFWIIDLNDGDGFGEWITENEFLKSTGF